MILLTDGATSGEGDAYVSKSGTSLGDEGTLVKGFHAEMSEQTRNNPQSAVTRGRERIDIGTWCLPVRVPGLQPMISTREA